MLIRIFDFNVWDENPKSAGEIVDFIFSHDAHIVCLQEVREDVLAEIQKRDRYLECAVAHDTRRTNGGLCFLVTLSRFPVIKRGVVRAKRKRGWRSIFSNWWHNITEHLESLRADVLIQQKRIKILNVHLEVGTGPKNRLQQFRHILRYGIRRRIIKHAIIAGDFNIYGQGWYERFVGWLWFGLRSRELFLDEREEFERLFKERGLKNIFRGETTFFAGGIGFQFDHIIVPHAIAERVSKIYVCEETCCSDHKPVVAEFNM